MLPAVKKVLEEEKDADVRFYAQDALKGKYVNAYLPSENDSIFRRTFSLVK